MIFNTIPPPTSIRTLQHPQHSDSNYCCQCKSVDDNDLESIDGTSLVGCSNKSQQKSEVNGKGARIEWLDSAKGLCLLLVILGHFINGIDHPLAVEINRLIYSFHMPFFFICSGMVLNTSKYSLADFISKRTKSLLVPAIIYQLAVVLLLLGYNPSSLSWSTVVDNLLYFRGEVVVQVVPVWFLITLFQAHLLLRVVDISSQKTSTQAVIAIICCGLGYLMKRYHIVYFGVGKLFIAMFFIVVGILLRKIVNAQYFKNRKSIAYGMTIALLLIWLYAAFTNHTADLNLLVLGRYPLYLSESIAGSLLFMFFCQRLVLKLDNGRYLADFDRYAILVIGSHVSVCVHARLWLLSLGMSGEFVVAICVVLTLLFVPIYLFVGRFVDKYVPILNGNMKWHLRRQ